MFPAVLAALVGEAAAAELRLFPVRPAMVPAVVAGAFMFPAVLGVLASALRRLGRITGPLLGVGLAAGTTLAVVGYLDPALLKAIWA